jgi:glycosyltransferase involved in cell wall biosynthesis
VPERRLLIVEEALRDYVGHWFEYVRAVAELARGDGAEVTIVGHAQASQALRDNLGVVPVFAKTPWDGVYRHRIGWLSKLGLVRHNALVFRRMRAFLRAHGPFDVTFAPTVVGHHVWAWRLLYLLYPRRIGRLVLLVRNNAGTYRPGSAEPRFNLAARLFGWGLRGFTADVLAGRVTIATDSARLAEEYRRLTGVAPVVFPSPRVAAPPPRRRRKSGSLRFACLGPARFEKGIDVLQRAIALYLAGPDSAPARFAIQWPGEILDARGAVYPPDPALAASGRVEFLTEPLDSAGYDALLAATDCMVLPYRRDAYFARISGVAVEAVTAGIPVIATADTWTGALVETAGAGLTVPDGDAAALAAAMAEVARDYPRFRAKAAARAQAAAAAHSGTAFLSLLWGR